MFDTINCCIPSEILESISFTVLFILAFNSASDCSFVVIETAWDSLSLHFLDSWYSSRPQWDWSRHVLVCSWLSHSDQSPQIGFGTHVCVTVDWFCCVWGALQDCIVAGLVLDVPQEFWSVHVLVCKLLSPQPVPQGVQDQLSLHVVCWVIHWSFEQILFEEQLVRVVLQSKQVSES